MRGTRGEYYLTDVAGEACPMALGCVVDAPTEPILSSPFFVSSSVGVEWLTRGEGNMPRNVPNESKFIKDGNPMPIAISPFPLKIFGHRG